MLQWRNLLRTYIFNYVDYNGFHLHYKGIPKQCGSWLVWLCCDILDGGMNAKQVILPPEVVFKALGMSFHILASFNKKQINASLKHSYRIRYEQVQHSLYLYL